MNTREEHTITSKGTEYTWIVCHRCLGSKVFECWGHVYNGKCFACDGKGGHYEKTAELVAKRARADKRAAAAAKRAAKRQAAAEAKRQAKLKATLDATPGLLRALELAAGIKAELVEKYDRAGNLVAEREELTHPDLGGRTTRELRQLEDLARKLDAKGTLTEKQAAFMLTLATPATCTRCGEQGHTERDCPKRAEVKPGRQVITGRMVSTRYEPPFVAWGCGTTKCLVVTDDGRKFWGTKPTFNVTQKWGDGEIETVAPCYRGALITFRATVERSSDDPHFGTFKRPAKGQILEQGPDPDDDDDDDR